MFDTPVVDCYNIIGVIVDTLSFGEVFDMTKLIMKVSLATFVILALQTAVLAEETAPNEQILLTAYELTELIKEAPCHTETRSATVFKPQRITQNALDAWIEEYQELGANAFELETIKLINIERESRNLQPLALDPNLMMAARFHSQEMADLRFFSHRSPHHGRAFYRAEMFGHENIQDHVWGVQENIAGNTRSPQEVVTAWMNSPSHRAAILGETFLTIGVGIVQGGGTTANFGS